MIRTGLNGSSQQGQSMLESLIAFPLLLTVVAGFVQVCWILLAGALMHTATVYVANYAAVHPDDYNEQLAIFWHRMKPLPGLGVSPPIVEIQLHEDFYDPKFTQLDEYGNEELRVDFARLRLAEFTKQEQLDWMQFTTPTLRIKWCFPLKIPLVNVMIGSVQQNAMAPDYCMPMAASGQPNFAIEKEVRFTLKNSLTIRR